MASPLLVLTIYIQVSLMTKEKCVASCNHDVIHYHNLGWPFPRDLVLYPYIRKFPPLPPKAVMNTCPIFFSTFCIQKVRTNVCDFSNIEFCSQTFIGWDNTKCKFIPNDIRYVWFVGGGWKFNENLWNLELNNSVKQSSLFID